MKDNSIEVHFMAGQFEGQVWIYKNLSIEDIINHYYMFPIFYLKDAVFYVNYEDRRLFLNDFFEITKVDLKKPWYRSEHIS